MTICEELEDVIAAYVLNAVDDADRKRVEAHLPHCPTCRRRVADFQPVVDLLAHAAPPAEPRREVKYRVLAALPAVARTPLPPAPVRWRDRFSFSNWLRSPAWSLALLVLFCGLAAWNVALQNQLAQQAGEAARQRDFLTLLAYADGTPRHLQGTDAAVQAVGRLYGTGDEHSFVVITNEMPKLPAGKVYQLWLVDPGGQRTSGGTFTVDYRGQGWLWVRAPQTLGQYRSVGVTVEPAGGSPGPTGTKMLGGNL